KSHTQNSVLQQHAQNLQLSLNTESTGSGLADACTAISTSTVKGNFVTTLDVAQACYESFLITPDQRRQQIEALKSYFKLDPHVAYSPNCFQQLRFVQPFQLAVNYPADSGEKPVVGIKSIVGPADVSLADSLYQFWKEAGIDVKSLAGFTVKMMDGKDPLSESIDINVPWAVIPANNVAAESVFRDTQSYYGYCAGTGHNMNRNSVSGISVMGSPVFKKVGPVVPGGVKAGINPAIAWTKVTPIKEEDLPKPFDSLMSSKVNAEGGAGGVGGEVDFSQPIHSDENGAFFMADTRTGVWVLSTFSPADQTEEGFATWLANVAVGLVKLESAGAQKLIIDVTNNGGGIVCAGFALVKFLFPKQDFELTRYDVRLSPELRDIYTTNSGNADSGSFFSIKDLSSLQTGQFDDNLDLFLNGGTNFTRGGRTSTYSHRFVNKLQCVDYLRNITDPSVFRQLKNGWDPKDIAVVSNGYCGSTCANVVRLLRSQFKIKSFTYGGGATKPVPFQPTSFEGGIVADMSKLRMDAARSKYQPQKFPYAASGTITFWESYFYFPQVDEDPVVPGEWVPYPSEFYLQGVNSMDARSVWNAVIAKMGSSEFVNKEPVIPEEFIGAVKGVDAGFSVGTASSAATSGNGNGSGQQSGGGGFLLAQKNVDAEANNGQGSGGSSLSSLFKSSSKDVVGGGSSKGSLFSVNSKGSLGSNDAGKLVGGFKGFTTGGGKGNNNGGQQVAVESKKSGFAAMFAAADGRGGDAGLNGAGRWGL
ncbi:hypothetical protein HDU76_005969, partial [Blyttiomyces sp. JEL0837]